MGDRRCRILLRTHDFFVGTRFDCPPVRYKLQFCLFGEARQSLNRSRCDLTSCHLLAHRRSAAPIAFCGNEREGIVLKFNSYLPPVDSINVFIARKQLCNCPKTTRPVPYGNLTRRRLSWMRNFAQKLINFLVRRENWARRTCGRDEGVRCHVRTHPLWNFFVGY